MQTLFFKYQINQSGIGQLKCDGTTAETRVRLSAKRTSPFKYAGASVQSTTGSRGVRISGGNAGYKMFRGSVKGNGYPLHSPVSPSLPLPCVTVCHHVSTGVYNLTVSHCHSDYNCWHTNNTSHASLKSEANEEPAGLQACCFTLWQIILWTKVAELSKFSWHISLQDM